MRKCQAATGGRLRKDRNEFEATSRPLIPAHNANASRHSVKELAVAAQERNGYSQPECVHTEGGRSF